jgi:hypothetical protein
MHHARGVAFGDGEADTTTNARHFSPYMHILRDEVPSSERHKPFDDKIGS